MKIGPSGTPPLPNQSPIFNFLTSRGGILRGLGNNSDVIVCLKKTGDLYKGILYFDLTTTKVYMLLRGMGHEPHMR